MKMKKVDNENKYDFNNSGACTKGNANELQNIMGNLNEEERLILKIKTTELEFAKNLIRLRKEKGFTQADMAKRTGLTQQAISTLEKCDRKPTLPNLIRYLLGLDIDINKIFN